MRVALTVGSCLLAVAMLAQEPPPKKDSDLVAAAKKAKVGRVAIPRKVITNADVKKAKGKLIELPATSKPLASLAPETSIEKHEADRKAVAAEQHAQAVADKKVADLEKELAAIEQSYYEENDPAFRDDVIRKKFEAKKLEVDAARAAMKP